MSIPIANAMTVDLEDWFCVWNLRSVIRSEDWERCELRIEKNTLRLLGLFEKHGVRATFFVLGWVAERVPGLIREIERRGHEIATHGYSHRPLIEMTAEDFDRDLRKAVEVTGRVTRQPILGFRAPTFSLEERTMWALDVLQENGIRYDSSMMPQGINPDYGVRGGGSGILKIGPDFFEAAPTCVRLFGMKIPCGGGYFRLFPYGLMRFLLRRCEKRGLPIVFYIHPWEIDPEQPRVRLSWLRRFRHYHNLEKTEARLERLLGDFRFTTLRNLLGLEETSDAREGEAGERSVSDRAVKT